MMIHRTVLKTSAVALAVAWGAAAGQGGALPLPNVPAPAPAPAASAPPTATARPGPRPMSPAEMRDAAAPTADQRPEGQVTPQLSIPLGRTPPAPLKLPTRAANRSPAASAGAIDDGAARCEAASEAQLRASCRDTLARGAVKR